MKNFMRILIVILLIVIAKYGVIVYKNWMKYQNTKEYSENLSQDIEEINSNIKDIQEKIKLLNDKFYREKIARNKLQMIKNNEKIYRYIEK